MKKIFSFVLGLSLYSSLCLGGTTLVRVIDGDTIVVNQDGKEQHVRVAGLDAPEISQPYGDEAKTYVQNKLKGNAFTLDTVGAGIDRYGRTLAKVRLQNGNDLGLEVIKAGLAYAYAASCGKIITNIQKYGYDPAPYMDAESAAKVAKIGLWKNGSTEPPCVYRKNRRLPKAIPSQRN